MPALRPASALRPVIAAVGGTLVLFTFGCSSSGGQAATTYDISAGDATCDVEKTSFAGGEVTFKVENTGSDVTEVYVYAKEGGSFTKIVGEVEDIGPGTSRSLKVSLSPGPYQVACKPGMTGDGIRTDITVTGQRASDASTGSELAYDRELEFSIAASGDVEPPASKALSAGRGERIEFKLHNDSSGDHYLELLDPDGQHVSAVAAEAGAEGEFVADLTSPGHYTVSIYREGAESSATSTSLTVK
jgi:iron uptake system component EfeO